MNSDFTKIMAGDASMCRLRLGSDAQQEAQHVAKEVYKVLLEHYPVSAKSLVEGVL